MLKKPLFWIILLIILIILWFIFAKQKDFHQNNQGNLSMQIKRQLTTQSNLNDEQSQTAKRTLEAENIVLMPPRNKNKENINSTNVMTEDDWETEILE